MMTTLFLKRKPCLCIPPRVKKSVQIFAWALYLNDKGSDMIYPIRLFFDHRPQSGYDGFGIY